MDFEKKLIILTGKTGRGTALIERNGMGTFITLNTFSLPDVTAGEYALGIKTAQTVYRREVGSLGRIKSRFSVPVEGDAVHLVVFRTSDEEVVLYGTSSSKRMWDGNLMDGLRSEKLGKTTAVASTVTTAAQDFSYSERKIEDYFLNIDRSGYDDGAVADVNYFEFSPRVPTQSADMYYDVPPTPEEMRRRYLKARFGDGVQRAFEDDATDKTVNDAPVRERAAASAPVPKVVGFGAEQSAATVPDAKAAQEVAAFGVGQDAPAEQIPQIKRASDYTAAQAVASVKTEAGFFTRIKDKIGKLFEDGERFAPLEAALPGTRWVRIPYDGSGRYYTVGLIGDAPDYIAYAVPGTYGEPKLEGADFIPLNADAPSGEGFWVLFQSAETGKEVSNA